MAQTKAFSNRAVVQNGGTALGAGDSGTKMDELSLASNAHHPEYGSKVFQAVSPADSGNLGTLKAFSAGVFGKMEEGKYIMRGEMSRLAQTDSTLLRCPGSQTASRKPYNPARGNHRYDNTSWDYVTGALTKGGSAGASFTYVNPVGGSAITQEAFPTAAVPGELCYMVTGASPTQDDYAAVYSK
jgi:hypothetical protein